MRLESEETTGVWFEIEHVCARGSGLTRGLPSAPIAT